MRVKHQKNFAVAPLGAGASAIVYIVDDNIVLKAPKVFEQLPKEASAFDKADLQFTALISYEDLEHERQIFQQLPAHDNIVKVVALRHPEGIYLQRHEPLPARIRREPPSDSKKRGWYLDIVRALKHMHDVSLVHADVRIANLLCNADDRLILCDFALSDKFGADNPAADDLDGTLNINGPFEIVSDVTDRFALASVIFELETGQKPTITWPSGNIHLPQVRTGSEKLDTIILRGWHSSYSSTGEMLKDIEILQNHNNSINSRKLIECTVDKTNPRFADWRSGRIQEFGGLPAPF